MQVEEKSIGNIKVIEIFEKRLVAKVAIEFKKNLLNIIQEGNYLLVLDLSNVEFIDSSGLGAIVTGLKALKRKGDIVISGPQDDVMQMFSLTRMDKVFKIFPTQEQAIDDLKG